MMDLANHEAVEEELSRCLSAPPTLDLLSITTLKKLAHDLRSAKNNWTLSSVNLLPALRCTGRSDSVHKFLARREQMLAAYASLRDNLQRLVEAASNCDARPVSLSGVDAAMVNGGSRPPLPTDLRSCRYPSAHHTNQCHQPARDSAESTPIVDQCNTSSPSCLSFRYRIGADDSRSVLQAVSLPSSPRVFEAVLAPEDTSSTATVRKGNSGSVFPTVGLPSTCVEPEAEFHLTIPATVTAHTGPDDCRFALPTADISHCCIGDAESRRIALTATDDSSAPVDLCSRLPIYRHYVSSRRTRVGNAGFTSTTLLQPTTNDDSRHALPTGLSSQPLGLTSRVRLRCVALLKHLCCSLHPTSLSLLLPSIIGTGWIT
jgi:hypothetical protein